MGNGADEEAVLGETRCEVCLHREKDEERWFGFPLTGGEPMRALVWMVAVLFVFAGSVRAEPPKSDDAAKRLLSDIHEEIGHLVTLYCGCPCERARNTRAILIPNRAGIRPAPTRRVQARLSGSMSCRQLGSAHIVRAGRAMTGV